MNINSGIFLANGSLIIGIERNGLWFSRNDSESHTLVSGYEDIRFLAASPYGEYLAFWSDTGASFRLIDLSGELLWSCWINPDRAIPYGIHFSASDNAVAFIYNCDAQPGMFFCDIETQFTTTYGRSGSPIGYDANMQNFVMDSDDPYEYEGLALYEHLGLQVYKHREKQDAIKSPSEIASKKIEYRPIIVDRYRRGFSYPVFSMRSWDGLVVQNGIGGIEGFVILKKGSVHWLAKDSDKPDVTVNDCLPQDKNAHEWYRCTLNACGDIALIQSVSYGGAIVVNRNHGIVWRGNDLSSVTLAGQRVLAQYSNRTTEVIRSDGSLELKYVPPSGFNMEAADIIDNVLYVAEAGRRFEVKTFALDCQ